MSHTTPPTAITVDMVIFTIRDGGLHVLLVRRDQAPHKGMLALPGGFLEDEDPDLDAAATRELREETDLDATALHLEQIGAYGATGRDPRGRVVTIAYVALVPRLPAPVPGGDAAEAGWFPVDASAPGAGLPELAFDHARIVIDGLAHVQRQIEDTPLATGFCPPTFTVAELRQVYETVWGVSIDKANFRRKVVNVDGFLVDTGEARSDGGRPAAIYRCGPAGSLYPPIRRPPVATQG